MIEGEGAYMTGEKMGNTILKSARIVAEGFNLFHYVRTPHL